MEVIKLKTTIIEPSFTSFIDKFALSTEKPYAKRSTSPGENRNIKVAIDKEIKKNIVKRFEKYLFFSFWFSIDPDTTISDEIRPLLVKLKKTVQIITAIKYESVCDVKPYL